MPSARSRAIDALRGIAVLLIVLHHACLSPVGIRALDGLFAFFADWGTLGVDLFFVLSGFCIHGAYSGKKEPFSVRQYLLRRWWRIYPPYFFALGLAVLLNLATFCVKAKTGGEFSAHNFGPAAILSHVFLVHNAWTTTFMAVSGPFWTIALEAQYYLLYLAVRPMFESRPRLAALLAVALVLHFAAWQLHERRFAFQPLQPFQYWIQWLLGAWLAARLRNREAIRIQSLRDLLVFALLMAAVFKAEVFRHSAPGLQTLLAGGAFAFLISSFLGLEAVWATGPLRALPAIGLFSYSIYLVHFLFLERLRVFVLPQIPEGGARLAGLIASAGISVWISALFFRRFEKPYLDRSAAIPKAAGV